jgi:hypothetical protein
MGQTISGEVKPNTINNYHGFFTYDKIHYYNTESNTDNVYYEDCVLLEDISTMKQGDTVPYIYVGYYIN